MKRRNLLKAAALAPVPLAAQDVGLGVRKGPSTRLEAPYTTAIETPHTRWANPLPGGPIRLLAVPSVSEGRTVIELAQRLSLDLTTVSIDPEWDVNKWTMCFGRDYGARAERGNLSLIYSYLEQELLSPKHFDAILLPLNHGWSELTEASRNALTKRVEAGAGLVLIRPFTCPLSPLEEAATTYEKSPWQRDTNHYITRAIPVEAFPSQFLEHHRARLRPNAEALIQSTTGTPILAATTHQQGRVLAFGYRSYGISWHMPMEARHHPVDLQWEYFYALLCRALIYAAKREPSTPLAPNAGEERIRNIHGIIQPTSPLTPGRYFRERRHGADWNISVIDIPGAGKIENLKVEPAVIREAQPVTVTFNATSTATVELLDGLGRVLATATGNTQLTLTPSRPLVHSGVVRVTAGSATEIAPIHFEAHSRDWHDYEVMLPWAGPRSYQPWMKTLDQQFRRIGITTLATPERNFRFMVSAHLNAFGIYWYRRDNYLNRKKLYAETKDKKHLTREITLQSPAFEQSVKTELERATRERAALKPFAYYLADESSLTCYTDAFDVDWAPESLAGFRQYLQTQYASLAQLNAAWSTQFPTWDAVVPMTTEEAQKHSSFAPWAEHRIYMDREFVQAFAKARDWLKQMDPGARPSISGTQVPTAHNGCDWYAIDQELEYIQPYSGGGQDAMHYLFNPKLRITGFTGYGDTGDAARYQQWQRLFYGHCGASIFWHYTLLNPDLTFSPQGAALAETFAKLQSGIARVFMNSTVIEDKVAIHFSMASIRGAWITDGRIQADMGNANRSSKNFADLSKRRDAWVRELERQGIQFRFLATPQIERGELDNYKVLILPYSIALSDAEIAAINRFTANGGRIFADEHLGKMDHLCRYRNAQPWPNLESKTPGDIGLQPALNIEAGPFLRTVRQYGASKLYGLLPKEPRTITIPKLEGVTYDLLKAAIAAPTIETGPGSPALLLTRQTRIAKLEITGNNTIRLTDEQNNPVDRSVVRIQSGDYSTNVAIENGQGRFELPTTSGPIQARDVISGLTATRKPA
ncbi:MAG: beta-galactosidase [Acidobacteria bacterium]|nr:beta-galactosidase [Acidobacteriota bacterium]